MKIKKYNYSFFKFLILATFFGFSSAIFASQPEFFNVGFNQAWFNNSFSNQWINPQYDNLETQRVLDLTKNSHSQIIRVWLFEGMNSPSLIWKEGKVAGLHPDFLKNFGRNFLNGIDD